ncbi:hypothetical protein KIN20_001245 [Parelaphostrongylus tenuis]|uniref:ShKT domain-containing protein n=1 Tax=Parelaphostrongylus tenuis TaxID=148309 RepID=A0AAD5QEE4_PARTN|nr:hypothetical protein KIN20_001245 [Parelaphostrongylus tenuis]
MQESKLKQGVIYVELVTVSTGTGPTDTETTDDDDETATEPTEEPTPQPTERPATRPTATSRPGCKDSNVCTSLMKWNFCKDPKYNDTLRRQVCPKSCGFC